MLAHPPQLPGQVDTVFLPSLHRVGEVEAVTVRAEGEADPRTLRLSVSSEAPVGRWFGEEILDHGEGSVRLERLSNRAPFLFNHDSSRQIGVVERAWIEGRRLRAEVRMSRSSEAEAIFADIKDGIRSKISVGYRLHKFELEKSEGDSKTYRATSWEPMEVSLVSVPADDSVGIGRGAPGGADEVRSIPVFAVGSPESMNAPNTSAGTAPAAAPVSVTVSAPAGPPARSAQSDASRILALGDTLGRAAEARTAVGANQTFDEFIAGIEASRAAPNTLPAGMLPAGQSPAIGMSPREIRRFSVCRAIACIANGNRVDGLEGEASQAFAQRFGLNHGDKSFFIPWDIQRAYSTRADLGASTGPLGGATVQTDVLGNELIELLRARLISGLLGVRTMFGLQGNVSIPSVATGATGAWLAEGIAITPSNPTFGQVPLSPKRYGAATAYSRQLVVQSTIDVENFVRLDLAAAVARAFDFAVLAGPGTGGSPTGIIATAGIGSVTFGGAATWAKVVDFETAVAAANADYGALAYVTTPATRGKWKQTPKVSGQPMGFLWQDSGYVPVIPSVGSPATPEQPPIGIVNGYRAIASTIIPTNRVIFGNFADAILAMWIPLEVVVDPYSLALNHQVRVVVNALGDVGVRHAASFAASTDTGAA
jgi:HK97 family phage major capsid protein/HK97 family phage prohead protease